MKSTKKLVCLCLVLVCIFALTANAFALTGTVKVNDYLNVRKSASTSGTIKGYLANNDTVTIKDSGSITNGFYKIDCSAFTSRDLTGARKALSNCYGSSSYIK